MPRGRIKSFPRFSPEKKGKKQYREAANLNRANTQGDIYPFANTVVFQNVTRASESLRPLWRKKYVHGSLQHSARYTTQTKPTSELNQYNTSVLRLMCKNRTSWVYGRRRKRLSESTGVNVNPCDRCDTEEQETVTNSETHHLTFYKLSCDPAPISMSREDIFIHFIIRQAKTVSLIT